MSAARLKRPMYAVGDPRGPTRGYDVTCAKFAVHRYETNLLPKPITGFTPDFGPALKEALKVVIQPREGIEATGNIGAATWEVLWAYLDPNHRRRYRLWKLPTIPKPRLLPDLGPLYVGGASVLKHQLTHNTDGDPELSHFYPAFDDGWVAGRTILAVEDLLVREASSATVGDAFYAAGQSKLDYWYGHLVSAPSVGSSFEKGEPLGKIANQGDSSHVHLGIDTRALVGRALLYGRDGNGPDYTYGAAPVGAQLAELLSL